MDILLSCFRQEPTLKERFHVPRFIERLALVKAWEIKPAQHLLDIGCGQGESSIVLALEQGEFGHVTAIDTAPSGYGSPFTVGESQQFILESVLGPRITFLKTDASSLLEISVSTISDSKYDAAVIFHSLWYFPNSESIFSLFQTLASARIPRIYLAEYILAASIEAQVPHLLSAQVQALFHSYRAPGEPALLAPNIRAALSQSEILEAAERAGFGIQRQGKVVPGEDFLEGHFEAKYVEGALFHERVIAENLDKEKEAEVLALAEQAREEIVKLTQKGISTVRAMDVWWAELTLNM